MKRILDSKTDEISSLEFERIEIGVIMLLSSIIPRSKEKTLKLLYNAISTSSKQKRKNRKEEGSERKS